MARNISPTPQEAKYGNKIDHLGKEAILPMSRPYWEIRDTTEEGRNWKSSEILYPSTGIINTLVKDDHET